MRPHHCKRVLKEARARQCPILRAGRRRVLASWCDRETETTTTEMLLLGRGHNPSFQLVFCLPTLLFTGHLWRVPCGWPYEDIPIHEPIASDACGRQLPPQEHALREPRSQSFVYTKYTHDLQKSVCEPKKSLTCKLCLYQWNGIAL